jgi:hypothetical protein
MAIDFTNNPFYVSPVQTPTAPQPTANPYSRQQQIGLALSALSDVLGKRDPIAGTMQRQAVLRQQQMQAKTQEQQEEQNKLLDEAVKQSPNITEARKKYLYSLPYEQKQAAFLKFAQPNEKKLTQAIQDYEYFSKLPPKDRELFLQGSGRGTYSPELVSEIEKIKREQRSKGGLDLTPGEEQLDKSFAKDYTKWEGGEKQQSESNITNLENKIATVLAGANVSGPAIGYTPDLLKALFHPQATSFKDEMNDIVFQSLRATLGAQFTEREAQRLVASVFNDALDESFNIPRLQRLLAKIKAIYVEKQNKADYYSKAGTLKGYVGETSTFDSILDSVFFDELSGMTNEEIIERYKKAPTQDERSSILRYAQSLKNAGE